MRTRYIIFLALWIVLISFSAYYLGIAYPLWMRALVAGALGGVSAYLLSVSAERNRKRTESNQEATDGSASENPRASAGESGKDDPD